MKPSLENAQPLCPLHGMPPMQRAWSAKPGDVVIFRLNSRNPDLFKLTAETLEHATQASGVKFILVGPDVEVVPPDWDRPLDGQETPPDAPSIPMVGAPGGPPRRLPPTAPGGPDG